MKDAAKIDRILIELRKISDELRKSNDMDDYSLVNFYRDSLEFMTDETLKSYTLVKDLLNSQLQQERANVRYNRLHES